MNLLPRPRSLLLDESSTVTAVEPTVRVGAAGLPPQGYALHIDASGAITIDAADPLGAAYGRTTLAQLAHVHDGRAPVGTVRDWPDLPIRGVMLDISRDKVPSMVTLLALVDRLASWKVNQLQLYTEHTFMFSEHEVVWRDASPMTAAEIHELDAHCRARHIELVPNQNCLGHLHRFLEHPEYAHLAMDPDGYELMGMHRPPSTIEPTNPASWALVSGLLAEVVPHFPGARFVHVGLDEPWELPAERIGDYLDWLRRLRALPVLDGREMLVWGDILAGQPDRIRADEIPGGVTVVEWGYDAGHPWGARLATLAERGIPRWVAPGTSSWLTILGRVPNMVANCVEAVTAALDHDAGGVLVTDWGDNGHLQYLPIAEPGLAFGAAVGWCRDSNAELDLAAALDAHVFDDPSGVLGEALVELGSAYLDLTPQVWNVSALVLHLYYPQLTIGRGPLGGATADDYTAAAARLERVQTALDDATPRRPDGALVIEELRNAIALVHLLCDDARARLDADGTLAGIPAPVRAALADGLAAIVAEHERLWMARNRPGGLRESRAWLDHLGRCYADGSAPRAWSGP